MAIFRRREFFRVRRFRRRYDKRSGKFVFNIAYETATKITSRTLAVAEAFGLGVDESSQFVLYDNVQLKIGPTDIVYITGDSGSGKSVLLKAIKKDLGDQAVDMAEIQPEHDRPLIETVGETVDEGLDVLCKVGLNDAFLFLRTYEQLSDGQKYRYRIAKLIESNKQWWIMDEFCSTLDRDTAKIVSFNLQKLARKLGKAVIAATTHKDLAGDLNPSVHIHKRFGKEITVKYMTNRYTPMGTLARQMKVVEGTYQDWRKLAGFHYRSHRAPVPRKIFCLKRGDELCSVIVYCYPLISSTGRRKVLPKMSVKELNEKLSMISRVVVHPKYRGIGLGQKLVRETLDHAGTEFVEMIAVMAKYNPFAEKAGMKKIVETPPRPQILALSQVLTDLGFNVQLIGGEKYVLEKLTSLKLKDLARVREAFIHNKHPRFMKCFFHHDPYGKAKVFEQKIWTANLEKLAQLIRVCGQLLQTKVYLFWKKGTKHII